MNSVGLLVRTDYVFSCRPILIHTHTLHNLHLGIVKKKPWRNFICWAAKMGIII